MPSPGHGGMQVGIHHEKEFQEAGQPGPPEMGLENGLPWHSP